MTNHAAPTAHAVLTAVTEYGRAVTLTQVAEGTYDPTTGTYSGGGETDYAAKGMLLGYNDRDIDGMRILAGDRKCILAASGLGIVPAPGDKITPSGDTGDASLTTYSVISVKTYELQGLPLAYVCQVRTAS